MVERHPPNITSPPRTHVMNKQKMCPVTSRPRHYTEHARVLQSVGLVGDGPQKARKIVLVGQRRGLLLPSDSGASAALSFEDGARSSSSSSSFFAGCSSSSAAAASPSAAATSSSAAESTSGCLVELDFNGDGRLLSTVGSFLFLWSTEADGITTTTQNKYPRGQRAFCTRRTIKYKR